MLAYTNKAREVHIIRIQNLISEIGKIPGNAFGFMNAAETIRYLAVLEDLYRNEIDPDDGKRKSI